MTTRMEIGREHERKVAMILRHLGWACTDFGQAMLSDEIRCLLRRFDTEFRWMPDLLAVRTRPIGSLIPDNIRLVDAKYGRLDTLNYDIEERSLRSHHRWQTAYGLHVWIVFADYRCCTAADLAGDHLERGTWVGTGSGTPFWLVKKDLPIFRSVEEAFG